VALAWPLAQVVVQPSARDKRWRKSPSQTMRTALGIGAHENVDAYRDLKPQG
jgi:hypothetical protein